MAVSDISALSLISDSPQYGASLQQCNRGVRVLAKGSDRCAWQRLGLLNTASVLVVVICPVGRPGVCRVSFQANALALSGKIGLQNPTPARSSVIVISDRQYLTTMPRIAMSDSH